MQLTIEDRSSVHVVHVGDERMGGEDQSLIEAVTPLIDGAAARVVIDLSAVKFINSSSLGSLVSLTARANQYGSQVALASPSAFVAGVLETTQLNRFLRVFPSVDAAIAGLA